MPLKKNTQALNLLELTPYAVYESEQNEEGLIVIKIPRFKSDFAKKFFKKRSPFINVKLEKIGSQVWRFIDGKTNVAEIINQSVESIGSEEDKLNERTAQYINQLYANGFISFIELNKDKKNGSKVSGN